MSGVESALLILGILILTIVFTFLGLLSLSGYFIKINGAPEEVKQEAPKKSHVAKKRILRTETTYVD
jgi:ABC-type transport system involved in cytochrome bd biosynthesis fused ATPase/permease subunit